ncbi:hypothetical protein B0H13DRAFT_1893246 [Mycena leptocephala]|nr:hypothetical protein B0H13DRAFT_1893246 [Mycena leptocephala]
MEEFDELGPWNKRDSWVNRNRSRPIGCVEVWSRSRLSDGGNILHQPSNCAYPRWLVQEDPNTATRVLFFSNPFSKKLIKPVAFAIGGLDAVRRSNLFELKSVTSLLDGVHRLSNLGRFLCGYKVIIDSSNLISGQFLCEVVVYQTTDFKGVLGLDNVIPDIRNLNTVFRLNWLTRISPAFSLYCFGKGVGAGDWVLQIRRMQIPAFLIQLHLRNIVKASTNSPRELSLLGLERKSIEICLAAPRVKDPVQ